MLGVRTIELVNDLATLEYIDEVILYALCVMHNVFAIGGYSWSIDEKISQRSHLHLCWRCPCVH